MSESPNPGETINLAPGKDVYKSAAVDVDYVEAVKELVDNAIDNWARVSRRTDDVIIDVMANGGTTVVRDDTGGLPPEQIHVLFALGETIQSEVPGSIGAYGIGAKKAIVRLGDEATIKSRTDGESHGVGFSVNQDWLNSDDWDVELKEYTDLDPRETVVEVHSDDDIWNGVTEDSEEESRVEVLRRELGETYAKFIRGTEQGGSVTIKLNGDPVEPMDDIDWAYSPFDGMYPRRYENIELDHSSLDEPIQMDVTVGFMTEQNSDLGGTDFYCQDRLVIKSNQDTEGGYGSTSKNKIGKFTDHKSRLRVIVELNTLGDSSDLPWDGQKASIDPYHPVTRIVHDWLRRLVKAYFTLDAGKVYSPYVRLYGEESDYAANDGKVKSLDYAGRERVGSAPKHKPDTSRPQLKKVEQLVHKHAQLGVKNPDELEPWQVPAYRARLESKVDMPYEDLPEGDEAEEQAEDVETDDGFQHLDDALADVDGAGQSRREALFEAGFRTKDDLRDATKEGLMAVDGVGARLADAILEAVGATPDEAESDSAPSEEEEEPIGSDENDTSMSSGSTTPSRSGGPSGTVQDTGEAGTTEETESAQQTLTAEEGEVIVPVKLEQEEFEEIIRKIGLPEDAELEEIGEALRTKLVSMYATPVHAD